MRLYKIKIILVVLSLVTLVSVLWRITTDKKVNPTSITSDQSVKSEQTSDYAVNEISSSNEHMITKGVLDTIDLVRIKQFPEFRELDASIARNETFRGDDGKMVKLQLKNREDIIKILPSPSHSHYMVTQGAPRVWSIYSKQGEFVTYLPTVKELEPDFGDRASIQWRWRFDSALIAILEVYPKQDPSLPRYPESDNTPTDVRFYDYNLNSKLTRKINIPEEIKNGLIRLEGVSEDGGILISKILKGGDYWGPRDNSELHAFKFADQKKQDR